MMVASFESEICRRQMFGKVESTEGRKTGFCQLIDVLLK